MRRTLSGSLALLSILGATAWAQEAVPRAGQEGGNSLVWFSLLIPTVGFVLLLISISRRQKATVDRSLRMGEEGIQLARQQVALQEETNRLLKQLISAQGHREPE